VVADGDVFVLAQSLAVPAIRDAADQLNGSGWFNGDDAVVLRKNGVAIDSLGRVGQDPGTEWGSGLASTADNTLRRKVCGGDANPDDDFDPAAGWEGFATDTFGGLGAHSCNDEPPPPPPVLEVFEIQGNGLASPFAGQIVRTEDNVVTAVGPNTFSRRSRTPAPTPTRRPPTASRSSPAPPPPSRWATRWTSPAPSPSSSTAPSCRA
jgi:uncharacterized protein